jgi:lysophospholipase L1-like esterase
MSSRNSHSLRKGKPLLQRLGHIAVAAFLSVLASSAALADAPLRLHLAGDSTMSDKLPEKRPETGWGEPFAALFAPGSVLVINHARNGRSTRTFIEEGRWKALVEDLGEGDLVFIQFGHNDQSEHKPDRYTPLPEYRANLERFVREVRARGGEPLLLTPIARRRFDGAGELQPSHGDYPAAVRELARSLSVPLIDAEALSSAPLRAAGVEGSKALFLHLPAGAHPNYPQGLTDDTHLSPAGARLIAEAVARALREAEHPLAARLQSALP